VNPTRSGEQNPKIRSIDYRLLAHLAQSGFDNGSREIQAFVKKILYERASCRN
jgi:hypothetical protein